MSTLEQARDAIAAQVRTGWLADVRTSSLPLLWDDVDADKPDDESGLPEEYGRVTIRHSVSSTETQGVKKELHEGFVTVQCFAPKGKGYLNCDQIAQVVKRIFQRQRITGIDGWFFGTTAQEVPNQEERAQVNVTAQFRYSETVP